jgi:hypothetical protein
MIEIVSRVPASTHQHINNGASNDNIMQFWTLFPQSIHIIMSSIHSLTILWKELSKLIRIFER